MNGICNIGYFILFIINFILKLYIYLFIFFFFFSPNFIYNNLIINKLVLSNYNKNNKDLEHLHREVVMEMFTYGMDLIRNV